MNKNVPNILTMSRIAFTPLVILFFLLPIPHGIGVYIALGIYVLGCFTDLLDGKIARKYNLISDFGKFMDQIADKFITTTAMILVLFVNVFQTLFNNSSLLWLEVVVLLVVVLRDILISGIRMVAANKNFVIPADIFGKVKSLFLDVSNMILMLYIALNVSFDNIYVDVVGYVGFALMMIGLLFTIISCINYSKNAVKALSNMKKAETETENK